MELEKGESGVFILGGVTLDTDGHSLRNTHSQGRGGDPYKIQ